MSFETNVRRALAILAVGLAVVALGASVAGSRDRDADEDEDEVETPEPPDAPGMYWVHDEAGAYLGVQTEEDTESPDGGARITEVIDGSPADHAGLEDGDVIVSFDGSTVRGPGGLAKRIRSHDAGDKVSIVVLRDGKKKTIDAELGERKHSWAFGPGNYTLQNLEDLSPEIEEGVREGLKGLEKIKIPEMYWNQGLGMMRMGGRARLGVQLVEATPELRQHFGGDGETGVLVSKVIKGMPAEHAGIRVGDMIVAIDDQPIESVEDLREALADRQGDTFGVEVIRNGDRTRVEVSLPDEDEEDDSAGPRAFLGPPPPLPAPPAPALRAVPAPPAAAPPAAAPRPAVAPRSAPRPLAQPAPPAPPQPPVPPLPPAPVV